MAAESKILVAPQVLAEHSKLGASSYYRWAACPGSIAACAGIESVSSVYAAEGTRAHTVAAEFLNGVSAAVEDEAADFMDAVDVYVNHIQELRSWGPSFEAVEQKFHLKDYHPELYGTADYVAYYSKSKTLRVVDYKHGAGIPVEVERSSQLMYYGLGALHVNKFPIDKIILTIVQPRCYHPNGPVRSWETDPIDMLDFAAQLIDDARATENPGAVLNPGDHCRFCPAQPTCPAVEKQALIAVQSSFTNLERYDPEKVAKALTLVPQIEAWCKSVREFAYQQAMVGNIPPGFKLVDKRAMRKWVDDTEELAIFLGLETDDLFDYKLKTPAQVEKLLPKDKKKLLEAFTVKESSGKNLVQVKDDREPVQGALESVFQQE